MTLLTSKTLHCAVCEHPHEYTALLSYFSLESEIDLDGRGGDFDRWLLDLGVQHCAHCGTCWSNLERFPAEAQALIQTPRYRAQLESIAYPTLANQFLCKAFLESELGQLESAAYSYQQAAWACDDEGRSSFPAMLCRMEAIQTLQSLTCSLSVDTQLTLIDLMRRTIYQQEAAQLILELLPTITDDKSRQVLAFQLALLEKEDDQCHTVREAFAA